MILMNEDWKRMFLTSAKILKDNHEMLSHLDSVTGDGDHGVTIKKIADILERETQVWPKEQSLKDFLDRVGFKIMNVKGGSAGPLWGTVFMGFSEGLTDEEGVSREGIKKMFLASMKSFADVSNAKVGEKTMVDAFFPAVKAIENSTADVIGMLDEAAKAAKEGADKTVNYIAKYGRAKALKEKSIGHKDPGAVSISLLIEGFAQGAKIK